MADILPPTSERNTKALLEKPLSGVTPVDTEGKIMNRIHEVLAEQKGTLALESMKVIGVGQERIDLATSKLVVLRERDKSTAATPEDRDAENKTKLETKQRTIKANGERVETYLKEGFEKADKATIRSQIEASFPRLWPEAATELADMKRTRPTEYAAFVDTIANDPRYAGVVQEVLKDATDPEKKLPEIPQALRDRLAETQMKAEANKSAVKKNEEEQTALLAKIDRDFAPGKENLAKDLGALEAVAGELKTVMDTAKGEVTRLSSERDLKNGLINNLARLKDTAGMTELIGQISTLDRQIAAENKTFAESAGKLARLDDLRKQKTAYEAEQKSLEAEHDQLKSEESMLQYQLAGVKADMDSIELDREQIEGEYTRTLEETFKLASEKYFTGRYEDADKAQLISLEEHQKAAATDEEKKVYDDVLLRRWRVMKNGRRGAPDKKLINEDVATLLGSPDGPALLLTKLGIPEAIREKVQPEVIKTLLQERLKIGGFKQSEVEYIADSRWGNGLLEAAVQNNEALKGHLESLKSQGILQKTKWEGLKEFADRHPVLKKVLLSLLLAGVSVTLPVGLITALAGNIRPMEGSMANLIGNKIGEAATAASGIPLGAKAGEVATAVSNTSMPTVPKIS